jgi:hypothetical protein
MDFLAEENHGVRFPASLCMPKHTQFLFLFQTDFTQIVQLSSLCCMFSMALLTPINWWFRAMSFTTLPKELSNRMKFSNKSRKAFLLANANNNSVQGNNAIVFLSDALPFVEVLILARNDFQYGFQCRCSA